MVGTTEPATDQLRVQVRQGALFALHWIGRTTDPTWSRIADANGDLDWVNSIDGLIRYCRWFVEHGILTGHGFDYSRYLEAAARNADQPDEQQSNASPGSGR
ncbi:hypothetical protein [Micromonospora sp. Llam0]|uniref:hypothetical protein n=1 Tax=Micromonospora sp. Llam0 TaxID=2485143 RepID=UPI0013158553|nr:hypothetical protein [Micromonospora sp. Llam0]